MENLLSTIDCLATNSIEQPVVLEPNIGFDVVPRQEQPSRLKLRLRCKTWTVSY